MARTISSSEFVEQANDIVAAAGDQTIFLEKDGKKVAAIVSIAEYESTHEAKVERALAAMDALASHMASVATREEIDDLVQSLDRHAS